MNGRIVLAVLLAVSIYAVYSWYSTKISSEEGFDLGSARSEGFAIGSSQLLSPSFGDSRSEGFDINSQNYEYALPHIAPVEAPENRVMASSGPSAPSQRPPRTMPPVIVQEERPFDPQEQSHESAEIPERLRHPERLYSPGLVNEGVEDSIAAGTANYASQVTQDAAQVFGPEFAQNGGLFMEGIMANDTELDVGYSAV